MNKYLFRLPVLSLALAVPLTVAAVGSAILTVQDTIAGLGTSITVEGLPRRFEANVVVVPPLGPEIIVPVTINDEGKGVARLSGKETELAGTYTASMDRDGEILAEDVAFDVLPESLDPRTSSIEVDRTSIDPDGIDTVTITVIARDRYGNPLSGRPMELVAGRSEDRISLLGSETNDDGEQMFQLATSTPGTTTVRAIDLVSAAVLDTHVEIIAGDTVAMGGPNYPYAPYYPYPAYGNYAPSVAPMQQSPYTASVMGRQLYGQLSGQEFDVVAGFEIRAPREMMVNEDATITITAVDRDGRRVEDYTGTVLLSSTDPSAFLPLNGEIPFLPQNLGEKTLTLGLRFRTPSGVEPHVLVARDSTNETVEGIVEITVAGGAGAAPERSISITSHSDGDLISKPEVTLRGKAPAFINLVVSGGTEDVRGDSKGDTTAENFEIVVRLKTDQRDHTLRIRDDQGRYDSGDLHLILDQVAPEVVSFTFEPSSPEVGEETVVTVVTEADAKEVKMILGMNEYLLSRDTVDPTMYRAVFTPEDAGAYQPALEVQDLAGNVAEIRGTLKVLAKGLPAVQNLTATPQANAVMLQWDPITTEKVDRYRIYVSDSDTFVDEPLETEGAVARATVAGLEPGTIYTFAVTAIEGERESLEPSIVRASPLGLSLTAKGQDGSILLEWTDLGNNVTLSSWLLEYNVKPDAFHEQGTERRTLHGDLRAYILRDLINDVAYYIRLTPVSVNGEVMQEIAATAKATPVSDEEGFHASAFEPAPFDIDAGQPPPQFHREAPAVSRVGSPIPLPWLLVIAGLGIIVYLHWQRRRTQRMMAEFFRHEIPGHDLHRRSDL